MYTHLIIQALYLLLSTASAPYDAGGPVKARVVHFPKDRSLGKLLVQDANAVRRIESFHYWIDGTHWKPFGIAQGDVAVPAGKRLMLTISYDRGPTDLSDLRQLAPDDLYELSISGSATGGPRPDDTCVPGIIHLAGLKVLMLHETTISPKGFGLLRNLKYLERLSLSKGLTDEGLAEIAQLQSLKGLYLGESQVTNAGLAQLGNLTALEELELSQGRMTNAGLAHLAKLPSLRYLMLSGKNFTDAGMAHLKNIRSLRILHAGHLAHLTDAALVHLADVPNLESLSLYWVTEITDDGVAHLTKLPSLKKLDIWHSKVTDEGLGHLGRIKTLEYLDLPWGTSTSSGLRFTITDKGLAKLVGLTRLTHLHLGIVGSGIPITDEGFKTLARIESLEELTVGGKEVTDEGIGYLTRLKRLKALSIYGCPNVTNKGLAKLTALKSLQDLSVGGTSITITGLSCLNELPNLTKLRLGDVQQDGFALNISKLKNLEQLSLQLRHKRIGKDIVYDQLRDQDLACLAGLTQLTWLQVAHGGITDDGLKHLGDLTNIERLSIGGEKITDKGLLHLMNMHKLDTMTLSGSFTDAALLHLERLRMLQLLDIVDGANFSQAAVRRFRRNMPDLTTFRPNLRNASRQQPNQPGPSAK